MQDGSRGNRSVPIEVFYPAVAAGGNQSVAAGTFPVIVFGHGFAMNYDAYGNLWDELVPRGYILVFPKTETSVIPPPSHGAFAQDLVFLKSIMEDWNINTSSPFYQKLSGRFAFAGHSMGGGASVLAASIDTTVTALFNLAAAETNPSAIQAAENVSAPTLVIAGAEDCVAPPNGHQIPIYDSLASDCKYYVSIIDGMHCRFANSNILCDGAELTCQPIASISRGNQHSVMFAILNPWLDFFLKGDCGSWGAFSSELNTNTDFTYRSSCDYQPIEPRLQYLPDTVVCLGDSVTLINPDQIDSIIWGNGQSGVDSITIGQSGSYSYTATDKFGCQSQSPKINITTLDLPEPNIILSSDTFLCPGDTVLVTLSMVYPSYLWTNGDTSSDIRVFDSVELAVFVTDTQGCSNWSDTTQIISAPFEARPSLTVSGDTLRIIGGNDFQWYRDSTLLIGETLNFIVVDSPGFYYAELLKENGCPDRTDSFELVFDAIPEINSIPGLVWGPNPSSTDIQVQCAVATRVSLLDLSGRVLGRYSFGLKHNISCKDFPAGLYLLEIETSDGQRLILKQIVE